MLGLIKKDLLTIKGNLKIILIIFGVFVLMSIQGKTDISFILPLICIMMFMSTFSYDEFNNWNAYAITLPNGRSNVVKSKYLATLILVLISSVITTIITIIISYISSSLDIEKILSTMIGSIFSVILIESLMYPLIFKFGIEKGRIGLFVGVFAITALLGLILPSIDMSNLKGIEEFMENYFIYIIPILMALMLIISYQISKKIYLKKEF